LVEISIADTGPGIAAAIRAKLFQPFVTSKAAGMGVGLSISRSIVDAHGGRLWAEDNVGGGTVFRFTVPSLRRDQAEAEDRPDAGAALVL
jgi:two-component system sensor kinase FixL